MAGIETHAGRLGRHARLYRHLTEHHRADAMGIGHSPDLVLIRLGGSHDVFLMRDRESHREYILKSFAERGASAGSIRHYLDNEYDRLKHVRKAGVAGRHWQTVKPVCRDEKALFFVEQHLEGTPLDRYLHRGMAGDDRAIKERLDLLAGFFARLHAKTKTGQQVDASSIAKELERHARQSKRAGGLDGRGLREAKTLARRWCRSHAVRSARQSLTHGDATPSNFLCRGDRLFVIDLERSKYRDPVYDLGMMAGELFHAAMAETGHPYRADRYIRRFYETYAGNFPDPHRTFDRLTARNPLYMANSLLRMSRNGYFGREYRRRLAFYALECLRSRVPD